MILVALLSLLRQADAAERPLPRTLLSEEPSLRIPVAELQSGSLHFGLTAAAQVRVALPFGSADRGTVIVGANTIAIFDRIDYAELFDPGWGFTLEADLMARPPPPLPNEPLWTRPPEMGGYVAVECDWFGGSETHDRSGTLIRPETLRLPAIYVGAKFAGVVEGPFFGDIRFGMGAAHYPSLEARFRPSGGAEVRGELFAETWTFAMELRMHFGWHLGPAGIVFGFGGRLLAPPERGANSTLDPDALWTLDFDLGVEIGF